MINSLWHEAFADNKRVVPNAVNDWWSFFALKFWIMQSINKFA